MKYNIEKLDAILSDKNTSFAERVEAFKHELHTQQLLNNQCPDCNSTDRQQCQYTPKVCLDCCECAEHIDEKEM